VTNKVRKSKRKGVKKPNQKNWLGDLVLLRNDPELVDEVMPHAMGGNINAQYALGLIFAEARGTDEDLVKSFAWLSIAATEGDSDAESLRYIVGERMTCSQLDESLVLVEKLSIQLAAQQHEKIVFN